MSIPRRLPPVIRASQSWRLPSYTRCFSLTTQRKSYNNAQPPLSYIPYVTEVSAGGWKTSDIFSKCLQERIVYLIGEVDDGMSATAVAQLLWLESADPERPITMYINSPGGSVSAGLAIYDTMNYIKPPVSTVCIGMAASMGALLLTGGEPGKRFSLPHSSIMIHQPLGGTRGQASDILIYANQIQRIRKQINLIYEKHLNTASGYKKYDLDIINDMMERDKYLSPEEAKALGIIDDILTKRPEVSDAAEGSGGGDNGGGSGGKAAGGGSDGEDIYKKIGRHEKTEPDLKATF